MKIENINGLRPRHVYWLGLLFVFGMLVIIPAEGRLTYSRSDNSQAPEYEKIDSSTVSSPATDTTHDHARHAHLPLGHIPDDGRFTTAADQSWPPQYKAVEDVTWYQNRTDARSARDMGISRAQSTAERDDNIQALLGERHTFISSTPIETKWESEIAGHTVTWFSYSNNVTVEAVVQDGQVMTTQTYDAADYQPPLRQNEVEEAIKIARQYWIDQQVDRVDQLIGYTIQTFQTEGDGGYFDTRMTYVSFHADLTSEPELMTWVDLTDQTAVRGVLDTGAQNDD